MTKLCSLKFHSHLCLTIRVRSKFDHLFFCCRMNDNFYPSVTWDIPISEKDQSHLTKIERDQHFITWLAALNENTGELIVLKTIRWKFNLVIGVDPHKPLGKRAKLITNNCDYIRSSSPRNHNHNNNMNTSENNAARECVGRDDAVSLPPLPQQQQRSSSSREREMVAKDGAGSSSKVSNNSSSSPTKLVEQQIQTYAHYQQPEQIPVCAMMRPSANHCQVLFWRPSNGPAIIVVPPKELYTANQKLIIFSGKAVMYAVRECK